MNITIGRPSPEQHPNAQAIIQPEDGRWQVVVDAEGFPHFYIEVPVSAGADTGGKTVKGMLCIEDMLLPYDDGSQPTIRELMSEGQFEGELPEAEKAEAAADWERRRAEGRIPCPAGVPPRRRRA